MPAKLASWLADLTTFFLSFAFFFFVVVCFSPSTEPRSLLLDEWPSDLWQAFVACGGNRAVNGALEHSVPAGYSKPEGREASRGARDHWIRCKYATRAFVAGNSTPPLSADDAAKLESPAGDGASAASATAMIEYAGMIAITLVSGQNLMSADANGLSDPYVKLRLGAQEVKSKIVKKSLNPVWNEKLMLCVPSFGSVLELAVFDWDKMTHDDKLGTGQVTITPDMEVAPVDVQVKLDNAKSGIINLTIHYTSLSH